MDLELCPAELECWPGESSGGWAMAICFGDLRDSHGVGGYYKPYTSIYYIYHALTVAQWHSGISVWCLRDNMTQPENMKVDWNILEPSYPIGSMYAIYGNIYHQYTPNVSIYTSTMDPMVPAWSPRSLKPPAARSVVGCRMVRQRSATLPLKSNAIQALKRCLKPVPSSWSH